MTASSQDPLVAPLAKTVALLLEYIDQRPDDATADDDVKALESAAYVLTQVEPTDRERMATLLGAETSRAVGLIE